MRDYNMNLVERKGFDGEIRYEVYEAFYVTKGKQHLNKETYLGYIKELPKEVLLDDMTMSFNGKCYRLGGRRTTDLWEDDSEVVQDPSVGMIYDIERVEFNIIEVELMS